MAASTLDRLSHEYLLNRSVNSTPSVKSGAYALAHQTWSAKPWPPRCSSTQAPRVLETRTPTANEAGTRGASALVTMRITIGLVQGIGKGLAQGHTCVMDDTTAERLARLRAAGDTFKAARAAETEAREALIPAMLDALRDPHIQQTEVIELSGYTRDRVRVIARNHGIEPR